LGEGVTGTMIGGRGPDQLGPVRDWQLSDLFGPERLEGAALQEAVDGLTRSAFGHGADPDRTTVEPVGYAFGSPATAALLRVRGRSTGGAPWSLFCKVLQHPRHWRMIDQIPAAFRQRFLNDFPWRQELDLWTEPVRSSLPPGLRAPHLHALVDLGDDQLALWLEDVRESTDPWDLTRFATAARALGRWNQRASTPDLVGSTGREAGWALRVYYDNGVVPRGVAPLSDDRLWQHPWLASHADLRARLRDLATRVPAILDAAEALAQCRPHGDASPQNLLVPVGEPGILVPIDISFQAPYPLGGDLSQLVVGLVHADEVSASDLAAIADAVVVAYVAGLREEGWDGDEADVERGFCVSALLRSGFDGFRYDLLAGDPDDPEARRVFDERVALARFIADRAALLA
jgi:hypothetical protein